jgi:hypothetical protein
VVARDAVPRDVAAKANLRDEEPRDVAAKANPRDEEPRDVAAKANPRAVVPRVAVVKVNPRDVAPVVIPLRWFPGSWPMIRMATAKSTRMNFLSVCNGSLSELTQTRMEPWKRVKSKRCCKILAVGAEAVKAVANDPQDRLMVSALSVQVVTRSLSIEIPGDVSDL